MITFFFCKTLEIPIVYEVPDEGEISPDCQFSGPGSAGSGNKIDLLDADNKRVSTSLPSLVYSKIFVLFEAGFSAIKFVSLSQENMCS